MNDRNNQFERSIDVKKGENQIKTEEDDLQIVECESL